MPLPSFDPIPAIDSAELESRYQALKQSCQLSEDNFSGGSTFKLIDSGPFSNTKATLEALMHEGDERLLDVIAIFHHYTSKGKDLRGVKAFCYAPNAAAYHGAIRCLQLCIEHNLNLMNYYVPGEGEAEVLSPASYAALGGHKDCLLLLDAHGAIAGLPKDRIPYLLASIAHIDQESNTTSDIDVLNLISSIVGRSRLASAAASGKEVVNLHWAELVAADKSRYIEKLFSLGILDPAAIEQGPPRGGCGLTCDTNEAAGHLAARKGALKCLQLFAIYDVDIHFTKSFFAACFRPYMLFPFSWPFLALLGPCICIPSAMAESGAPGSVAMEAGHIDCADFLSDWQESSGDFHSEDDRRRYVSEWNIRHPEVEGYYSHISRGAANDLVETAGDIVFFRANNGDHGESSERPEPYGLLH